VLAQPVRATLPNGLRVHADYQRGQPGRAAVVIIHGFLQTQNFPTVRRLADALHEEEGYTVLTPTLSLGISDRRQSLACEAIQHHTMESSAAELLFWVRWLVARGHRRIALIGHSTGSLMVLAALPGAPPAVRQAILISLTYIGQHLDVFERRRHAEDVRRARERLARDPDRIDSYHIAYCKAYAARPGDVLSYYAWDQAHTLQALRKARVPATVILGSADRRIDPDWRKAIAATGTRMLVIEGANHFFDDAHEFDLLDAVSAVLAGGSGEAAP
ncbi:MAG: alpha/beta fold hydrolase, partial [Gammaproteobacteria bacterium]